MPGAVETPKEKDPKKAPAAADQHATEVSVRDLERKGLDKVKVLRESDLDNMIRKAVTGALAEDGRDREQLLAKARKQLEEQAEEQEAQRALTQHGEAVVGELKRTGERLEAEIAEVEKKLKSVEALTERRRKLNADLVAKNAAKAREGADALADRVAEAERRAREREKAVALLEKRLERERAAAEARRPKNLEPGKGLDVGTANLVSALQENDGPVHVALQRNAFIEIESDALTLNMLRQQGVPYADISGRTFVVGDAAFDLAKILNRETRRPMARGIVAPNEKDALPIMKLIIERLLGPPAKPGEICCFSVPAEAIDSDSNAIYHEGMFKALLTKMGYDARPVKEGHAVVLADLADDDFTGIGISCGGGMHNVCVAYKAVNVLSFSTARGGDWVDTNVAQVLGIKRARATSIKEGGVDLRAPKNREEQAVAIYYRELIHYTLGLIKRRFESKSDRPDFPDPVDVVFAGGTSLVGGFIELAREELSKLEFPIPVKQVRLAEDPLHAVSKGCLITALSGTNV